MVPLQFLQQFLVMFSLLLFLHGTLHPCSRNRKTRYIASAQHCDTIATNTRYMQAIQYVLWFLFLIVLCQYAQFKICVYRRVLHHMPCYQCINTLSTHQIIHHNLDYYLLITTHQNEYAESPMCEILMYATNVSLLSLCNDTDPKNAHMYVKYKVGNAQTL